MFKSRQLFLLRNTGNDDSAKFGNNKKSEKFFVTTRATADDS